MSVDKIFCAPGNAGINQLAECVNIKADDLDGLLEFALQNQIDLTVVGPEVPLTLGIVDKFQYHGMERKHRKPIQRPYIFLQPVQMQYWQILRDSSDLPLHQGSDHLLSPQLHWILHALQYSTQIPVYVISNTKQLNFVEG